MITKSMLAVCALALAFAVAPAVAAAEAPSIDPAGEEFPVPITTSGGEAKFTYENGTTFTCLTNSGEGEFTSSRTGTIKLSFHGCRGPLNVSVQRVG
jgi:hypothetical protein